MRASTGLPVLVGFGVREPSDVARVAPVADGVVVGAAVLESVLEAPSVDAGIEAAADRVRRLAGALAK